MTAVERVTRFLAARARGTGLDAEQIAAFGDVEGIHELRVSDLQALVDLVRELAGPLAAYDAAVAGWQQANAEQDDAPDVRAATRYSERLEDAAHGFAVVARPLLEDVDDEDERVCASCGDAVGYLSSRDRCDGCELEEPPSEG